MTERNEPKAIPAIPRMTEGRRKEGTVMTIETSLTTRTQEISRRWEKQSERPSSDPKLVNRLRILPTGVVFSQRSVELLME